MRAEGEGPRWGPRKPFFSSSRGLTQENPPPAPAPNTGRVGLPPQRCTVSCRGAPYGAGKAIAVEVTTQRHLSSCTDFPDAEKSTTAWYTAPPLFPSLPFPTLPTLGEGAGRGKAHHTMHIPPVPPLWGLKGEQMGHGWWWWAAGGGCHLRW